MFFLKNHEQACFVAWAALFVPGCVKVSDVLTRAACFVHKSGTKLAYDWGIMEPSAADNKREAQRFRVLKAGTIEFSGNAIPCTVRNLSSSGAAIEVRTPLWFPDHFILGIASDGTRRNCHIVWRDEKRIGLAFD